MKVCLQLPMVSADGHVAPLDGGGIAAVAAAAEEAGYDAVAVTEHPFPPKAWLSSGGHHAFDPLVALAFAASSTTALRLRTNLLVLSYRNPFLAAKSIASLDWLSGGRVVVGIGAGYLEPEFRALGAPFEERNERTDDGIAAMKLAWSGDEVHRSGPGYEAAGNAMLPRSVQQPHPPIWIGGNSRTAITRALTVGDGWMPFPNPASSAARRRTPALETLEQLRDRIASAHALAAASGRVAPLGVLFPLAGVRLAAPAAGAGQMVDAASQLAAAGVTEVLTSVRTHTLEAIMRELDGTREVVAAIAAIPTGSEAT